MNTRKSFKQNSSCDLLLKNDDAISSSLPSKPQNIYSPSTKTKNPINPKIKSDQVLVSPSIFLDVNITETTKSSLREILENVVLSRDDPGSFQQILDHIYNYSFGSMNRFVTSESFQSQVQLCLVVFYDIVNNVSHDELKIVSARSYVDRILGQRAKVNKKRKMYINDLEKEASECQYEQRLYFDAVFLLLYLSMKREILKSLFCDEDEFLDHYGDLCHSLVNDEINTLVLYRNIMKVAMTIIPASGNKGLLLDLVTRLVEGHQRKYVTGSGATIETKRRVRIYENEGEIKVIIRPERRKIKDARILGSLHKIRPKEAPYRPQPHPPTSIYETKPVIISPSMKSSGLEREAAESIALLQSSPPTSLTHELRLEESQESGVWSRALNQFSKETPLNRNHSLI